MEVQKNMKLAADTPPKLCWRLLLMITKVISDVTDLLIEEIISRSCRDVMITAPSGSGSANVTGSGTGFLSVRPSVAMIESNVSTPWNLLSMSSGRSNSSTNKWQSDFQSYFRPYNVQDCTEYLPHHQLRGRWPSKGHVMESEIGTQDHYHD